MHASGLCGQYIGEKIEYCILGRNMERTYRSTEEITMITHKKNGNVLVRHGKNNRQVELRAETPVEVLWVRPPVYTAIWDKTEGLPESV